MRLVVERAESTPGALNGVCCPRCNWTSMDNSTFGDYLPKLIIEPWCTTMQLSHYMVNDEKGEFKTDAYVIDVEGKESHPYPYCVVLYPAEEGWPPFLYSAAHMEGQSHEGAIVMAVAAYRNRYADLIEVLRATARLSRQQGR